jgi:hypothetical protein
MNKINDGKPKTELHTVPILLRLGMFSKYKSSEYLPRQIRTGFSVMSKKESSQDLKEAKPSQALLKLSAKKETYACCGEETEHFSLHLTAVLFVLLLAVVRK